MPVTRASHEVPTHLNVEDRLLLGLTVRQFLYVVVGCSASYSLWDQLSDTPTLLRGAAVVAAVLLTLAFTLIKPGGRSIEEWLLAGVVYVGTPRSSTWQTREPLVDHWRPAGAGWQELAPSLVWADEQAAGEPSVEP